MSTLPGYEIDVKTKVCIECGEEKPLTIEHYEIWYRSKDGNHMRYANSCKPCRKEASKLIKNYLKNNPIPENYKCPICKSTEIEILEETGAYQHGLKRTLFNVDHDHKTNKVRGIKWLEEKNNE